MARLADLVESCGGTKVTGAATTAVPAADGAFPAGTVKKGIKACGEITAGGGVGGFTSSGAPARTSTGGALVSGTGPGLGNVAATVSDVAVSAPLVAVSPAVVGAGPGNGGNGGNGGGGVDGLDATRKRNGGGPSMGKYFAGPAEARSGIHNEPAAIMMKYFGDILVPRAPLWRR